MSESLEQGYLVEDGVGADHQGRQSNQPEKGRSDIGEEQHQQSNYDD